MNLLTTVEAGDFLGVTSQRVRQLIKAGRLRAHRYGRHFLVDQTDLEALVPGKPGWPKGKLRKPQAASVRTA